MYGERSRVHTESTQTAPSAVQDEPLPSLRGSRKRSAQQLTAIPGWMIRGPGRRPAAAALSRLASQISLWGALGDTSHSAKRMTWTGGRRKRVSLAAGWVTDLRPVADAAGQIGWPVDCMPLETSTGVFPLRHCAPDSKKSTMPSSSHSGPDLVTRSAVARLSYR